MKNVLEYLVNTASRLPEKMAVTDGEEECSYSELELKSYLVGKVLSDYVTPGKPVAVMKKKSVKTLQIFLGTAYAGGFYCLLDPDFPDDRIKSQLATLSPEVVVTDAETVDKLSRVGYQGKVLTVDELFGKTEAICVDEKLGADENIDADSNADVVGKKILERIDEIEEKRSEIQINGGIPLYCNFTSGSTGVPKGVLVGHDSVISFIDDFAPRFGITEDDVIGNQAPFDFDVSVKDIYSALKVGATLVIIPTAYFRFPKQVMDMLEKYQVTNLTWAVSALVLLNRLHMFMYKVPPFIKRVLFSGEEMPAKHLKDWMDSYPEAEFVNLYGPTEITCNCSYYRIDRAEVPEKLPIGYEFPGKTILLLDDEGRIIPETEEGTTGEICVAGNELALCYYNNEEATNKAFVELEGYGRIYKTGDLGFRKDGMLQFAGRKDFQIKHNGHRIELEEIERAMNGLTCVGQACCIYDMEKYRIVAYYTDSKDSALNESVDDSLSDEEKEKLAKQKAAALKKEIVAGLKDKLPEYMIPNVFRYLEEMPLSKNGKVDRNYLRQLTAK